MRNEKDLFVAMLDCMFDEDDDDDGDAIGSVPDDDGDNKCEDEDRIGFSFSKRFEA